MGLSGRPVRHLAVTVIGPDRPGIIAAVSGVLMEHRGNLEDTSMSILGGHFAMVLLVAVPDDVGPDELSTALADVAAPMALTVAVAPVDEPHGGHGAGAAFTLTVYGADRPGIVHRVTRAVADHGGNVVDLATRVVGDPGRPVYVMLLDLTLPPGAAPGPLDAALAALSDELAVDCTLRPADADVL